ncbi:hypothetical protein H8356DRAFT_1277341 [Neocallimastix lanati (nom. inval.)]|uniref:Calcineurin-like phosphoesterase domain-containing protein n=1 Tax=Neocallimastix californiae TaxID=1754190 RepID=A0A1Y2AK10_9FUNG|nr:hypothetical protein H8356DRAFT_1277341 [Neocallimastix sp. JGI-2020a]ORY22918.1 hypothetical protein LY90DRAFT_515229 [Neocallimastix californiae]|eukprot:ORY22918.1 hypothetical protein LY90DRAFT_515229 [Neocallimastix californiae]
MYLSEFDGLLHLGDYDYRCLPDDYFTKILDANRTYQFMGVVGNHDTTEGECTEEVAQRYVDNIYNEMMSKKNKGLKCVFSPSKFMWSCVQDNIRIIGLTPDIRGADKRDEQLAFLKKHLKDATEDWKICSWHYYDKYYHTGRYQSPYNLVSGEGESFYDYCKMNGAIILSAHDHVYARTHVMSQFSEPVIDKYDGAQDGRVTQIRHGATLNILNGVGGFYIYIEQGEQMNYAHWQKKYARGKNEVNKDKFGGLFCTFNYKGNNKKAYCELLRLNSPDKVFDSFYIYRNEDPESVHYSEIDTAFKEEKIKAYKIANNIVDGELNNNTTNANTIPTITEDDTTPLQPVSSNFTNSNIQTEIKEPDNKSLLTSSAFLLTGSIVASLSVIGGAILLYKRKARVNDYYEDIGPLTVTVPNKSAYGYNPDNYLPPPPDPDQFGTLPVNYNNQYFDSHNKYN